jgi:hypothetical protein
MNIMLVLSVAILTTIGFGSGPAAAHLDGRPPVSAKVVSSFQMTKE